MSKISKSLFSILLFIVLFISPALFLPAKIVAQQSGITSPATGGSATGAIPVFGTATIEPFQKYELHYKTQAEGDEAYKYFDGGAEQINNGQLGVLQAGGFAPGVYSIRLRVVKLDGNYAEYFAQNVNINQAVQAAVPATTSRMTVGAVGSIATTTFTATPLQLTETPIPTFTFTPAPQPTPIVGQVTQPQVQTNIVPTRTPVPTSTAEQIAAAIEAPQSNTQGGESAAVPDAAAAGNAQSASRNQVSAVAEVAGNTRSGSGSSITRQLGETLAFNRLRTYFVNGMRYSVSIILLIVVLFVAKRVLRWIRGQV